MIDSRSKQEVQSWLGVASLAFGTFTMVTSEFLPIGLLPNIARDLNATDGAVGLMITVPGLVAAVAAPVLVVASGTMDRRSLLWMLSGLLVISNLIVAASGSLTGVLLGRLLLGVSVGGFWGFGAALAGRLVAQHSGGRAVTIVFAGISIGTVLGMPAGTLLGHEIGWRNVFLVAAGISLAVLAGQVLLLPRLPVLQSSGIRDLLSVFTIPKARIGLICVILVILGHFMAYTYITPFLERRSGTPSGLIALILLAYGTAGFVGNLVGGAFIQRNLRDVLASFALLLAGSLITLSSAGTGTTGAAVIIIIWGFAFGGLPVCLQTWMFKAAPEMLSSVSAVFVTTFQMAIAGGALLGGLVVNNIGLSATIAVGGATAMAAAIVIACSGRLRPMLSRD